MAALQSGIASGTIAMPIAFRALLLVLLALVPAGLVQGILEHEARDRQRVQLGEEAMRYARLVATQQIRIIEAARHLLGAMAAHEAVRAGLPSAECDAFLVRLVEQHPRFITANSFGTDGRAICSAQVYLHNASVAERPYFQGVMAGEGFTIGEYAVGYGSGRSSLHMAAPLEGADGRPAGVLVVALSVDWLLADLQALPLPPGTAATITDRHGVVLARTVQPELFVGRHLPDFALRQVRAATAGVVYGPSLDGTRRIAAYIPSAEAPEGLLVAVGMPAESIIDDQLTRDRRAALLILGSLLLSLLLAIGAFHLGVERPMQRVLSATQAWSRQQWSIRIGVIGGGREFSRLAGALDGMAADVQEATTARAIATLRIQALSDVSPQVVFTADARGRLDWVNAYWEGLTGLGLREARGMGWMAAIHPKDRGRALAAGKAALRNAAAGGPGEFSVELRLRRAADDSWRWCLYRAAPIRDGGGRVLSWAGVALDFHDLRDARKQTAELTRRLDATYRNAPVGLCLMDGGLHFLALNTVLADSNGATVEAHLGRSLSEMSPAVAPTVAPLMRRVLESGAPVANIEIEDGEGRVWLCAYHPVRRDDGRVVCVSGSALDITARKRAEEARRMLSREVDHRAKNVLTVVRSLVRLSAAESGDDAEGLVLALEGRIAALARVHTVLSREAWLGADLGEIVRQELAAYGGAVSMEGPPLWLASDAAQPLTLVLHELATNAAKHGALSTPGGRLSLRWNEDEHGARLVWEEQGGPELRCAPARHGFGSELIDINAGVPLDGGIEREWRACGLRCVLRIGHHALVLRKLADVMAN